MLASVDRESESEAVQQKPEVAERGAMPSVPASALRGTSNAALAAWLSRAPAGGQVVARDPDAAAMRSVETKMVEIKTAASERSTEFNKLNDDSIKALQDAEKHLRDSNKNYKDAYKRFTDKLAEADERFATEQAIKDAIQGILVAAALAAVGPELLVVKGGTALVEAAAATATRELAKGAFRAAAQGGVGEVVEMGGGAVVSGARGEAVRPGSTAAGGGATSGDKYEEAFGKLGEMVQAMPKLGKAATTAKDIGMAAGEVEVEAVRIGGGTTGKWTEAQVQEKATIVETANSGTANTIKEARKAANGVISLKNLILNSPVKTVDEIEVMIWNQWMASLEGDANEVLDNDKIQDYLTSKGLIAPGDYMSDSDQADAVQNARKQYLAQRGINVDTNLDSLYKREMKLDALKSRLIGKQGKISGVNKVSVDGKQYDSPGQMGGAPVGSDVQILHIIVKPHMQGLNINLAEWRDEEYDVMGNTVAAIQGTQGNVDPGQAPAPGPPPVPVGSLPNAP